MTKLRVLLSSTGHTRVPGGEPGRHLQQQASGAEEQRRGELDAGHEFDPAAEGLGQLDPDVRLRAQPVGLIEGGEQRAVEATAQAAAWQRPDLAERLAAQAQQRRAMRLDGGQRRDRQAVEQLREGSGETVGLPGATERGKRPAKAS